MIFKFLCLRIQRACVDGWQSNFCDVVALVLNQLLILYIADLFGVSCSYLFFYADDAMPLSVIPFSSDRRLVTESVDCDLDCIHIWCELWSIRKNSVCCFQAPSHYIFFLWPTHSGSFGIIWVVFDAYSCILFNVKPLNLICVQQMLLLLWDLVFLEKQIESSVMHMLIEPPFKLLFFYCWSIVSLLGRQQHHFLRILDKVFSEAIFLIGGAHLHNLWFRGTHLGDINLSPISYHELETVIPGIVSNL